MFLDCLPKVQSFKYTEEKIRLKILNSAISWEYQEAAMIDGAGKWKQLIHVTIPSIMPTIIIMLILRMGGILNVGYEKIILLYNDATLETADVISTYVYRKGLLDMSWSFSTAVNTFNSVINLVFLCSANFLSRKFNDSSLW